MGRVIHTPSIKLSDLYADEQTWEEAVKTAFYGRTDPTRKYYPTRKAVTDANGNFVKYKYEWFHSKNSCSKPASVCGIGDDTECELRGNSCVQRRWQPAKAKSQRPDDLLHSLAQSIFDMDRLLSKGPVDIRLASVLDALKRAAAKAQAYVDGTLDEIAAPEQSSAYPLAVSTADAHARPKVKKRITPIRVEGSASKTPNKHFAATPGGLVSDLERLDAQRKDAFDAFERFWMEQPDDDDQGIPVAELGRQKKPKKITAKKPKPSVFQKAKAIWKQGKISPTRPRPPGMSAEHVPTSPPPEDVDSWDDDVTFVEDLEEVYRVHRPGWGTKTARDPKELGMFD